MARYHGVIGYAITQESVPGVFSEVITEHAHTGDVLRDTKQYQNGSQLNDNLVANNRFSIIVDAFANENLPNMRYIKWQGTAWKITTFEVVRPRVLITIGGVYNGITT